MLRKLFVMMLSLLMLTFMPAMATGITFDIETDIPDAPVVTTSEFAEITAIYDAENDVTRYRIVLNGNAAFADGTQMTVEDLIFSLYYYLDPGYTGEAGLSDMLIVGTECYHKQRSEPVLEEARALMASIEAAGRNHFWMENDVWSDELQQTYWSLMDDYKAACEAGFPICAQRIVDKNLRALDDYGALGYTRDEVLNDESLSVAYTMIRCGYAQYDIENGLTALRSRTLWTPDTLEKLSLNDFVEELKLVYSGDLPTCWAMEAPGGEPLELPDVEEGFLAVLYPEHDEILSISGITQIDEMTAEVVLEGIDMQSAELLFGVEMLSRDAYAISESGIYGHPFGDVQAIDDALAANAYAQTLVLVEAEDSIFSF